ncbi:MAG TPA: peptidase C39 family protein [Dongiaceae bacterium]|nr:peptidase C39 family protein [Dongiaceae bacterium]
MPGRSPAPAARALKRAGAGRAAAKAETKVGRKLPYYNQSLDFTCGPASLMMAMRALDRTQPFDRAHELQLWREVNTVFMGKGHPGSSPYGLALAAWRRGFKPELWLSHRGPFLLNYQKQADRRKVSELMQREDEKLAKAVKLPVELRSWTIADLELAMGDGAIPLVLVSTRLFHGDNGPHWVAVSAVDAHHVYVNDPWITRKKRQTARSQTARAASHEDFLRMASYDGERAVVLISN